MVIRYQTNVMIYQGIDRWNKEIYNSVTDIDKELCVESCN